MSVRLAAAETQTWTLYRGRSRLPDVSSPDVRARSHTITSTVLLPGANDGGVLLAHGDRHAGYAVLVLDGRLVHVYSHAGTRTTTTSTTLVPTGRQTTLQAEVRRDGLRGHVTLRIDGLVVATGVLPALSRARTGYTGVDVGCDRGQPVGDYLAPARFTGSFDHIEVCAEDDQLLDLVCWLEIEYATG